MLSLVESACFWPRFGPLRPVWQADSGGKTCGILLYALICGNIPTIFVVIHWLFDLYSQISSVANPPHSLHMRLDFECILPEYLCISWSLGKTSRGPPWSSPRWAPVWVAVEFLGAAAPPEAASGGRFSVPVRPPVPERRGPGSAAGPSPAVSASGTGDGS